MKLQPYLMFGGNAEQALRFYERALGAKVEMLMRFREAPDPPPAGMVPPDWDDKVMHAALQVGAELLMMTDGMSSERQFAGFSLSLTPPDEAAARRLFDALSDGGKIDMPLGKTFWSPCFGMLTDRFGVSWMVGVA